MKTTRLITTLLASLALTTTAFAADAATAFKLKGNARLRNGESYTKIAVGNALADGSFVQVSPGSTLGLKTLDGGTVFFSENTSFRIRYVPDSGPGYTEITLISGTVSGTFNTGAAGGTVVRTSVGVVNTNGASAQITFIPSNTGEGIIRIVATTGSITFTPAGSTKPVTILAGSVYTNAGGAGVKTASAQDLSIAGQFVAAGATANTNSDGSALFNGQANVNNNQAVNNNKPDLTLVNVISPSGEGSVVAPASEAPIDL